MSNPITNDKCFQSISQFERQSKCISLGLRINIKVIGQKLKKRKFIDGKMVLTFNTTYQLYILFNGKKKNIFNSFNSDFHCYYTYKAYDYCFYNFLKLKDEPVYIKGEWWLNGKKVNKLLK